MQKWWPSTFNLWPSISMETTIALHASIFCPHLRVYWWGQHRRSGIHDHTHHSRPSCLPHLGLHTHDRSYTPDTARGTSWQHYRLSCSYHSRRGELIGVVHINSFGRSRCWQTLMNGSMQGAYCSYCSLHTVSALPALLICWQLSLCSIQYTRLLAGSLTEEWNAKHMYIWNWIVSEFLHVRQIHTNQNKSALFPELSVVLIVITYSIQKQRGSTHSQQIPT